jgi:hypothetical protein
MRKQLTPTEKLHVVRKARKSYMTEGEYRFLCPLLRYHVNGGKNADDRGEDYVPQGYLQNYMPEFYEYKPSHRNVNEHWWLEGAREPRLSVLDNLEARYYSQTTWLSRIWFKIKMYVYGESN